MVRRDRWVRWSYLRGSSGTFQTEIEERWVSRNCRGEREEKAVFEGKQVTLRNKRIF